MKWLTGRDELLVQRFLAYCGCLSTKSPSSWVDTTTTFSGVGMELFTVHLVEPSLQEVFTFYSQCRDRSSYKLVLCVLELQAFKHEQKKQPVVSCEFRKQQSNVPCTVLTPSRILIHQQRPWAAQHCTRPVCVTGAFFTDLHPF